MLQTKLRFTKLYIRVICGTFMLWRREHILIGENTTSNL